MKPGMFVAVILTGFASIMFPPLLIVVGAALLLASLAKASKRRDAKRAELEHLRKMQQFGMLVQDRQAPMTNPGWRL